MNDAFRLVGADGREYGPATAAQVSQWIREGRVHGQTRVKREDAAEWTTLGQLPEFAGEFNIPPRLAPPPPAVETGLAQLIPYRNGLALGAYYCAVFALIPVVGLLLGWTAFGLGLAGLRFLRRNPAAGGKVHAWIGIVLGALCGLGNIMLFALPVGAALLRHKAGR